MTKRQRKPIPHPENLLKGSVWHVWYSDHVSTAELTGAYVGFVVEYKTLWLLFRVNGEHSPREIPYKSIDNMVMV